jgi:hypothetical protein
MARIRTVKPEFWDDELLGSCSRDARLLYIALFNVSDDEGRVRWHPAYIKSKAFPYDDDLTHDDVARIMGELVGRERVWPYQAGGQSLGWLPKFRGHQTINRPQPSRLPPPPESVVTRANEGSGITHGSLSEDSVNDHGSYTAGMEGNGREGKGREVGDGVNDPAPTDPDPQPRKRGQRLPDGWIPSVETRTQMAAECPLIDLAAEHRKFTDYWMSKAGRDAAKLDWDRTWKNWIRNAKPTNGHTNGSASRKQQAIDQTIPAAMQRARERDEAREREQADQKELTA